MDDAVLQHLSKEALLAWIRCQRKCSRMTYPEHDALSEFLQEPGLYTGVDPCHPGNLCGFMDG